MIFAVTFAAVCGLIIGFFAGALYMARDFDKRLEETLLDCPEWGDRRYTEALAVFDKFVHGIKREDRD